MPCDVIIKNTLKQNFPINFPFILACDLDLDLYILSTGYVVHLHSDMEIERNVTMPFPESETVNHPQKREEKTQSTDSNRTIKLEEPTQLERTITTPQYN